jgi:hypothetical protein
MLLLDRNVADPDSFGDAVLPKNPTGNVGDVFVSALRCLYFSVVTMSTGKQAYVGAVHSLQACFPTAHPSVACRCLDCYFCFGSGLW